MNDVAQADENTVVTEFEKAVKLVGRIEGSADAKVDEEAAQDLTQALSLGPLLVKGCYDQDSKRFGPSYSIGDYQAQVELRDVLLGLKGLVSDLKDVLIEETEVDLRLLQEVADTCRQNACACLGQLAQRLRAADSMSPAAQPFHMNGESTMTPSLYMRGQTTITPDLHYSTSRSTHSSSGGTSRIPKTPDPLPKQYMSPWQAQRSESDEYTHQRKNTEVSLQESYADYAQPMPGRLYTEREMDELSIRRPSSHTLAPEDDRLLSPTLSSGSGSQQVLPLSQQEMTRDSYPSSTHSDRASFPGRTDTAIHKPSRPRYDANDFSPISPDSAERYRYVGNGREHTANRRFHDVGYSTLEPVPEPQLQTMPYRPAHSHNDGPRSPPPRKPIPPVPTQFEESTYQAAARSPDGEVPTSMYGQPVPLPPRTQSRTTATTTLTAQKPNRTPTTGSSYQVFPQASLTNRNNQLQGQTNGSPSVSSMASSQTMGQQYAASPQQTRQASSSNVSGVHQSAVRENSQATQSSYAQSQQSSQQLTQVGTNQSTTFIPLPQNLPLSLPTENNTGAFCKGAFRLFIGLEKKAFIASRKPVGYSAWVEYWRCDKCQFEGPMREVPGPVDKKGRPGKTIKIFDPTARECGPMSNAVVGPDGRGEGSGGIRYKWAFLAKSHVYLKTLPEGKPDGSFGGFACMFCAAEGANRGWSTSTLVSDAASTRSGRSGHSSNNANTPVFGNLQLFMDHLQMHRRQENWPCAEMQGRMKCIVGRVADRSEEWEVNLLPS